MRSTPPWSSSWQEFESPSPSPPPVTSSPPSPPLQLPSHFLCEPRDLHHGPHMFPPPDHFLLITSLDLEMQSAAVDVDAFRGSGHGGSDRCGGQVFELEADADRVVSGIEVRQDTFSSGVLHPEQHPRAGEYPGHIPPP